METKGQIKKRNSIITLAIVIILISFLLPEGFGLSHSAIMIFGVFIASILLWLTVAIDWPSLLAILGLSLVPGLSFNKILGDSLGSSTFAFLLFTFICTFALSKTPFIKRCAVSFITSSISQKGPWNFLILYCFSIFFIGLFVSPTVLFVIYLPILEEICNLLELKKGDRFASALMMGQVIACAISSGITPISHVFGIMAMGFYEAATGISISYLDYMAFAIPIGIILFIVMILLFKFLYRPSTNHIKNIDFKELKMLNEPMKKDEKIVIAVFSMVVLMWILPDLISKITPNISEFFKAATIAFPPLLGAVILFIVTVNDKKLLDFNEALSKGVPWGSLIMAASTLALGAALTNEDIGITNWIINSISPKLKDLSPIILVLIFTFWAALQTNLSSNMVAITVVCAVAIPIAISTGIISAPLIAIIIGMMGAFAFATPPAHPNVALAVASGYTKTGEMLKYGLIMMIISVIVTVFIGYPIGVNVLGLI